MSRIPSYKTGSALNEGRSLPLRTAHATLDFLFIVAMLILLLCSIYIKMDSDSVYQQSDRKQWVQYKPDFPDDVVSFEELQKENSDVIGWLTIYGTTIDYPLVQTDNNNFYMNHDAKKDVSSGGALFLDHRNDPKFTNFNTIIHGHHMAHHKMFGDLDLFDDEDFFNKHEFGDIYFNDASHGFQIIAYLKADAYDFTIYDPDIQGEENRLKYISNLYSKATYIRGVDMETEFDTLNERTSPITPDDHIVLLNTCAAGTNERYLIVGKILDHTVENPYPKTELQKPDNGTVDVYTLFNQYGALPIWIWILIVILLTILVYILYKLSRRRDKRNALDDKQRRDPE